VRRAARVAVVALAATLAAGQAATMAAPAPAPAPAGGPCAPNVHHGVPPPWMRAGFSSPRPRIPHAFGARGRIAAIVFGDPLQSPPSPTRSNKILWVPRAPVTAITDLRITAQRMRGSRPVGRPVDRIVPGGPGPSIVDLPHAGCWRITAHWAGQQDELDLVYAPPGGR